MPHSARLSEGGGVQSLFGQCPNRPCVFLSGASLKTQLSTGFSVNNCSLTSVLFSQPSPRCQNQRTDCWWQRCRSWPRFQAVATALGDVRRGTTSSTLFSLIAQSVRFSNCLGRVSKNTPFWNPSLYSCQCLMSLVYLHVQG